MPSSARSGRPDAPTTPPWAPLAVSMPSGTRPRWSWPGGLGLQDLLAARYHGWLARRRWQRLRALGMQLGAEVNLPNSVWIDTSHCHLISIGDRCGFGDGVCILAHDALANEFLGATRVGRVVIHESCHIGARAVILPGVEIGPRAIVGAGAVVTRSVPPESVAAGNPARVLCSLEEHLARLRARLAASPSFARDEADLRAMSEADKRRMRELLCACDGFIVGGPGAAGPAK